MKTSTKKKIAWMRREGEREWERDMERERKHYEKRKKRDEQRVGGGKGHGEK